MTGEKSITVVWDGEKLRWHGLAEGAALFGYAEDRSFLRPVQSGMLLGAVASGGMWGTAKGMCGLVPGGEVRTLLPPGTVEVAPPQVASGSAISGAFGAVKLDPDRKHPYMVLSVPSSLSGMPVVIPWVKIRESVGNLSGT